MTARPPEADRRPFVPVPLDASGSPRRSFAGRAFDGLVDVDSAFLLVGAVLLPFHAVGRIVHALVERGDWTALAASGFAAAALGCLFCAASPRVRRRIVITGFFACVLGAMIGFPIVDPLLP